MAASTNTFSDPSRTISVVSTPSITIAGIIKFKNNHSLYLIFLFYKPQARNLDIRHNNIEKSVLIFQFFMQMYDIKPRDLNRLTLRKKLHP